MSPRRLRARDSLLSCLLISASLALTAFPADAQSVSGRARSPWMIWSDSRSDDWNEARERVRAEEARPLVEALSRRSRAAEGSARGLMDPVLTPRRAGTPPHQRSGLPATNRGTV